MRAWSGGALTIVICMASSSASANWQYTRWGMTPTEVISASHETTHLVQGTPGQRVMGADLRAEGTYSASGYEFKTQFFFDIEGKLQVVKLNLIDNSYCDKLKSDLESLYGISKDIGSVGESWIDIKNQNKVGFTESLMTNPCFVYYDNSIRSGGRGL